MWLQSGFKNIWGRNSVPPEHSYVTDFQVKNEILASTSILAFFGWEMIKISGLDTGLGQYGLIED